MAAKLKISESPEAPPINKGEELVLQYSATLSPLYVRVNECYRATDGPDWSREWQDRVKRHHDWLRSLGVALENQACDVKKCVVFEESIKSLKDTVKQIQEEYETHQAFRERMVGPFIRAVEDYAKARREVINEAREREQGNALLDGGILDLTKQALNFTYPEAVWHDEAGKVVFKSQTIPG